MRTYERKSFPRTARELTTMWERNKLTFDNAVQRSFVWKNTARDNRMSMLIDSMMRGLPIPPMYCNCVYTTLQDKVYDFIDGKQRITTVVSFLKDGFALKNIPVFEMEDGITVDLNGKKYSELPEEFQDAVRTYSFIVYYYENMDQEDVEEMFRRLNNGKSLSAIELTRVAVASKRQIKELAAHPIFTKALKERSLAGYAHEDIVMKALVLLNSEKKDLSTRHVREFLSENEITEEQKNLLKSCLDRILNICNSLEESGDENMLIVEKRLLGKTHLISVIPVVATSITDGIPEETMKAWLLRFFNGSNGATISERYNENAGRGSASNKAVEARLGAIEEDFIEHGLQN